MEDQRQQVGRPQIAKVVQLPPEIKIIDVFTREDVGGRLLILGEPGSGKTTTLLQLAEKLIEQAEGVSNAQVPVIFELSNWKNERQSLEQWLINQLKNSYYIDEKVSQKWLENERILPLLDGLDELGLQRQRLAINAINQYLHENISRRMVVCCRWEEYRERKKKLHRLHGAYYLQPPGDGEIRAYLERFNQQELWFKIDSNPLMKELAQKPLFLNLMIPAFEGEAILSEAKLFESYIAQKLDPDNHVHKKYPQGVPYTEEMTRHWLSYLARHLEADNLTVFLIEKMQSYWLDTGGERWAFRLIYSLIFALIFGLIGGLNEKFISGLIGGLIVGLFLGIFFWDFKEYKIKAEAFIVSWQKINKEIIEKLIFSLILSLIVGLFVGLILALIFRLIFGNVIGQIYGLIYGLVHGLIWGLIYGSITGLTMEIKTRKIPNQGIKEAFKKSLIIPFFTFPFFVLILPLTVLALGATLAIEINLFWEIFRSTFFWQISIGFGITMAMIISLMTGGQDWIQHIALRLILWLRKKIPWNYATFLDYTAERRLLQKTGGSYRFLHDSLRKYFCGNTPLPSHTIKITKNQWVGIVLLLFTGFSFVILTNSIYPVNSYRISLLTPSTQTHDIVFSDIISDDWRDYQRGDVIEFWIDKELAKEGYDADSLYIMRIIALPGETFEIQQGQVYINGQLLAADYLDNLSASNYNGNNLKISTDYYVVMGKKMDKKEERLVLSLVHKEQIVSRIIYRLWPLERLGSVE